jgi:hypothetical protein
VTSDQACCRSSGGSFGSESVAANRGSVEVEGRAVLEEASELAARLVERGEDDAGWQTQALLKPRLEVDDGAFDDVLKDLEHGVASVGRADDDTGGQQAARAREASTDHDHGHVGRD